MTISLNCKRMVGFDCPSMRPKFENFAQRLHYCAVRGTKHKPANFRFIDDREQTGSEWLKEIH